LSKCLKAPATLAARATLSRLKMALLRLKTAPLRLKASLLRLKASLGGLRFPPLRTVQKLLT
jgi:hypothetical protein